MPKKSDDYCPICGEFIEVNVSCFAHSPFIDGSKYELICFTCFCVPENKTWDNETKTLKYDRLLTADEMAEDHFDKKKAAASIKAIKKLLK